MNRHIAAGLLNGFWNFVVFSNKGTNSIIPGSDAIEITPMIFEGRTLSRSKLARKYHSGKISRGVAKGFAFSAMLYGWPTDRPNVIAIESRITTGKMYRISFGHAGSPYRL